jgi:mannosyltransferase
MSKGKALLLAILILIGFSLRIYHLDFQSLWRDEIDTVLFAQRQAQATLATFRAAGENGPLYFLIMHYWVLITGTTEFALRFFSLLWGVAAIPLVYVLGRRVVRSRSGEIVGLLAAVVTVISPYFVWYSQEAKMYALVTFLTMLSFYLLLRAVEENRLWLWTAYTVVTSLCFYTHLLAALILVAQDVWFVVYWRRHRPALKGWLISQAFLTLPYLPLAAWQLPYIISPDAPRYPFVSLPDMLQVLLLRFSLSIDASHALLPLSFFVFLFLLGAILFQAEEETAKGPEPLLALASNPEPGERQFWSRFVAVRQSNVLLLCYLFVPIVTLYLISLCDPLFVDRYLITVAPAYYLLLACGLYALGRRVPILSLAATAVLVGLGLFAVLTQGPYKPDYRSAALYYRQRARPHDTLVFVAPFQRKYFSYYYGQDFQWRDPPQTDAISEEELNQAIETTLPLAGRVWLFLAETHHWDSKGMIRNWFENHARLIESQTFPWVEWRCYALEGGSR